MTLERLELIQDAMERGGELNAQESDAVDVYDRESERLCRLAGLSVAEFELFWRRKAGGER